MRNVVQLFLVTNTRELKQQRFWATHVNRKWPFFSFFDGGFAQIFSQIASITVKKLRNTNFISSRHVKRENTSLPVDVRRSKTSLLKLPTILLVRKWNHACSSLVYVISVITPGRQRTPTAFRRYYLLKNKLSDRMIKQLLNSVIAKYCDLSAQINYLPKPKAEANSWSARYWQITIFCPTSSNNC